MDTNYKYKAFISYRHTQRDKIIAEKLQRLLENYKPPKGLNRHEKWKIFRDETELSSHSNLSGEIMEALTDSEFLIVICSETTKQSKWCLDEISYFKSLHQGSTGKIIPVVTGGDPEEVFPDELLTTTVLNESTGEYEEKSVEPLAANVSSRTTKGALSALKREYLRVAAPMLYCGYDNLYLRDRRRKRQRGIIAGSTAAAAVIMFSLYTLTMLMKISSQNADLENKNKELDLANYNLVEAYGNLDSANNKLEVINKDLDETNGLLTLKNTELDSANTELHNMNDELDSANTQLAQKNNALDSANTQLAQKNNELDLTNTELTKTNSALDTANTELTKTNDALDAANNDLKDTNKALDAANIGLEQSNRDLAKKTKEAQDNYEEANKQREVAEQNFKAAEEQRALAEQNYALAEEQRALAEENYALAEKQRDLAEKRNSELMIANAEISASNADAKYSYNYDRYGAVEQIVTTPLYQDNPDALRPSAISVLNKLMNSFALNDSFRLSHSLSADGYIDDFTASPSGEFIAAYDKMDYVYVFELSTGKILYKQYFESVITVGMPDNEHIVMVNDRYIKSIDFRTGEETWSNEINSMSRKKSNIISYSLFCDDESRLAVWDNDGYYAFVDSLSGQVIHSYKSSDYIDFFPSANQRDFSDGVNFSAICKDDEINWIININVDTGEYYQTFAGVDLYYSGIKHTGDTELALMAYTQATEDERSQSEIRIYDYNTNQTVSTIPLCKTLLSDVTLDKFELYDNGTAQDYLTVCAYSQHEAQPVFYVVNMETGEYSLYAVSAQIKKVEDLGGGFLRAYAENGMIYEYNSFSGSSIALNCVTDNNAASVDGSKKILWINDDYIAALGKNAAIIAVFSRGPNEDIIELPDETADAKVLQDENYMVCFEGDTVHVYDNTTNKYLYSVDFYWDISDAVIYKSQLVYINPETYNLILYPLYGTGETEICQTIPIDTKNGTVESWMLHVSDDGELLTVVTPYNILFMEDGEVMRKVDLSDTLISKNHISVSAAVSPDGKKVILQNMNMISSSYSFVMKLYDLDQDEPLELYTQLEVPVLETDYYADRCITFSADSSKAAILSHDYGDAVSMISVFDLYSHEKIYELPFNDRKIEKCVFENGEDRILVLFESYLLVEYDLNAGEQLNSLMLPMEIYGSDIDGRALPVELQLNSEMNELILYNSDYCCFVDLEYFEVSAEVNEFNIEIISFDEVHQRLIVRDCNYGKLVLIPRYTNTELFEKACALIAENN